MRSNSIKHEGNWLYLFLAFCVAIILWYTVNAREQIERLIDVRLDYKGLPQGLVVLSGQVNRVQVRVHAPRALFRGSENREPAYTVDLSEVKKGLNVIPFDKDTHLGLRLYQTLEVIPPRLTLQVDGIASRDVPVDIQVHNAPSLEDITVKWLSVAPSTVRLTGPESVINAIDALPVDANIGNGPEGVPHVLEAPALAPVGVEVKPLTVTAEYMMTINRRSLTLLRPLGLDGNSVQCAPNPARVRLRAAVPAHKAMDNAYLDQIRAVLNPADRDGSNGADIPIQVHLPEGARLESVTPTMARCE